MTVKAKDTAESKDDSLSTGADNWGEFAKKIIIAPSLVKFADEVDRLEEVQTEEIGTGGGSDSGYQRFDRGGSRFSGPPRGNDRGSDRGGRPPYERRNDYNREDSMPKRPAYNDREPRGNDRFESNDRSGGDRRDDRLDNRRGGDRNFDRPPRDSGYGGDRYGSNDRFSNDRRGGDRDYPPRDDTRGRFGENKSYGNERFGNERPRDSGSERPRDSGYGGDRFEQRDSYGSRPPYGGDRGGFPQNPPSKSLRAFSLPYDLLEADFRAWVEDNIGGVRFLGINFITDRETGSFKGFAFINFENIEDSEEAKNILANAPPLLGRRCKIDFSNSDRSRGAPRRD